MVTRRIDELLASDSFLPELRRWIASATNPVEVLAPPDESKRRASLMGAQVTTRSPMGTMAYHTGGLLIDHGWIRILGAGHPRLPRMLAAWNTGRSDGFYLVADDVAGGFFAINGGTFDGPAGKVFYFAPDVLNWEPMADFSYSQFLDWALSGDTRKFYETYRWTGWEGEVETMAGDQVISFVPPLWSGESNEPANSSRRPIPIDEAFRLNVIDLPRQFRK